MALSDTKIRTLKPKAKAYKLADEKGLFLLITPKNVKHWKFKYRFEGKEKKLSFGSYPEVKLTHAREKRDEVRKLLADSIDPSQHLKAQKLAQKLTSENSFEKIALEWHMRFLSKWTPNHAERILVRFKNDVFLLYKIVGKCFVMQ